MEIIQQFRKLLLEEEITRLRIRSDTIIDHLSSQNHNKMQMNNQLANIQYRLSISGDRIQKSLMGFGIFG